MSLAAAVAATVLIGSPVPLGRAARAEPVGETIIPAIRSDPRAGAWLSFFSAAGARLFELGEGASAREIRLPRKLRGEELQLTPLPDGWTVVTNRWLPGGAAEAKQCHERNGGPCGELVVAQYSPRHGWTRVQSLAGSDAWDVEPQRAVLANGHVELAWSQFESEPMLIATAKPGRRFGRAHEAPPLPQNKREGPEAEELQRFGGRYFIRAKYVLTPPVRHRSRIVLQFPL